MLREGSGRKLLPELVPPSHGLESGWNLSQIRDPIRDGSTPEEVAAAKSGWL
jgi:hypothetical protein